MIKKLINIWTKAKDVPFNFNSFIVGLVILLLVKWISYKIFTLTVNIWASVFFAILVIPIIAIVFLFINKSRKSFIALTLCAIVIIIASGYEIKKFQKYRYGRKIDDCTIEKSLSERDFALIKFKNVKLLDEKFIYEVINVEESDDRYSGTTRNSGTSYFSILIPFVDNSYTSKDSIYYYYLVETEVSLTRVLGEHYFENIIKGANYQKDHYLTVEEDDDLKEFIEENNNGVLISKNIKFVSMLESEEYMLTGDVEKFNAWYNYLQPFMFWLVIYGGFLWFKDRD